MKLSQVGFALRRAVAKRGIVGTLIAAPGKFINLLTRRSNARSGPTRQHNPIHPFDEEFGTDTSGFIGAEELPDSQGRKSIHNSGFYATSPSIFYQAFARLPIDFKGFTFIDLGAGKGRIVLLASNFPFRRVLGVEFVPELQAIATQNIARYRPPARQCDDVECILGDACDFVFPSGPLVIFMWNPFAGPVFERVIENLDQSLRRDPREVYLVYLKPVLDDVVQRFPSLHKIWESEFTMTEQDFAAYFYPDRSEVCAAYASGQAAGASA
jgi:predicted RNA methylase